MSDTRPSLEKVLSGTVLAALAIGMGVAIFSRQAPEPVVPVSTESNEVTDPATVLAVNEQRAIGATGAQTFTVTPIAGHVSDMNISLSSPDLLMESYPEGYALRMEGAKGQAEWGVPDVPGLFQVLEGHDDMQAQIEIVDATFRDFEGVEIAALPWDSLDVGLDGSTVQTSGRAPNENLYATDAFWPQEVVTVKEARQRDRNLVRVGFNPVQYNPVTKTVRYYETVDTRLQFVSRTAESLDLTPATTVVQEDPCACPDWTPDTVVPASPNGVASEFAPRRAGAEVDAVYRFTVKEKGLYRIRASAMTNAGVPSVSLVGSQIRLFCGDEEVALWVNETGAMEPNDWIMFYAEGFDGVATDENVYWLGFGSGGLRIENQASAPFGDADILDRYCETVTYGPNDLYTSIAVPQEEGWDHWYSKAVYLGNDGARAALNTTIVTTDPVPGEDATLCFRAVGRTALNHTSRVKIAGQAVASFSWYQDPVAQRKGTLFDGTATFSSSLLSVSNTVMVEQVDLSPDQPYDVVYLDAFRIIYPRELKVISDSLLFGGETGRRDYQVAGFTSSTDIWLFDVSNPLVPRRLTGFTVASTPSDGIQVTFGADMAEQPAYAVTRGTGVTYLTDLEKTPIRGLASVENQADWIVITPSDFRRSVYSLTTRRHEDGHNVLVAPISDIYNEFSYGVKDPDAIRQFLGYAYHHWAKPAPLYVLLAGKGTYDPRDYTGLSAKSIIPTHHGPTSETYTGLDVWFALVDGSDNLADMAVGRIPVVSDAQMQSVVDKILVYDTISATHPNRKKGTLVTGKATDGDNFLTPANVVSDMMTVNGFTTTQKLYDCNCNSTLLSAINTEGRFFVSYYGHGAANLWDTPSSGTVNLLDSHDVPLLNNSFWPIFTVFTCQNGYYLNPAQDCLMELLVERPSSGGIAAVASTGLAQTLLSDEVSEGFYHALLNDQVPHLGDALMAGQYELWSTYGSSPRELLMYQIFGDPGLIVNPN